MTSTPITSTNYMTIEEFIRRYDQEGPFELIDGEIVPKMPSVSIHNKLSKRFFVVLLPYEQHGLGEVFQEATFILTDKAEWVKGSRIPDVMFVSKARIEKFQTETPDWEQKPYIFIPNLGIKIVSPTDSFSDISAKVKRYLNDGVEMVWVVDPQTREITVYRQGQQPTHHPLWSRSVNGRGFVTGFFT